MITDPIANMLSSIKNALAAGHKEVMIPHSKMKEAMAKILVDHGYVTTMKVIQAKPQSQIKISLKYVGSLSAISGIKRISKPGRRLYVSVNQIPATLGGYGVTLISSNQGIITDQEARRKKVGGEIICQIW